MTRRFHIQIALHNIYQLEVCYNKQKHILCSENRVLGPNSACSLTQKGEEKDEEEEEEEEENLQVSTMMKCCPVTIYEPSSVKITSLRVLLRL